MISIEGSDYPFNLMIFTRVRVYRPNVHHEMLINAFSVLCTDDMESIGRETRTIASLSFYFSYTADGLGSNKSM